MNAITAGLLSGTILGGFFILYLLLREAAVIRMFREDSPELSELSPSRWRLFLYPGFTGAGLLLGLISGLIWNLLPGANAFQLTAFSAAGLFSLLALVTRTPLKFDKIIWNLAAGGILGTLLPLLTG